MMRKNNLQGEINIHLYDESPSWNHAVEHLPLQTQYLSAITSLGKNLVIQGGKETESEILTTHKYY